MDHWDGGFSTVDVSEVAGGENRGEGGGLVVMRLAREGNVGE